jgi:hypothetical protein
MSKRLEVVVGRKRRRCEASDLARDIAVLSHDLFTSSQEYLQARQSYKFSDG